MTRRLLTCVLTLFALLVQLAAAQENTTAARIAPFVDDQTIAVCHIDLATLNLDATEAALLDAINGTGMSEADRQEFIKEGIQGPFKEIRRWVADFRAAGGRHLYLVTTPADFATGPGSIIAPIEQGGDAQALASLLFSGRMNGPREVPAGQQRFPEIADIVNGSVFMGTREGLDRLKQIKAAPRPQLAEALAAGGDAPWQAVLIPTDDSRKVVEDLAPQLPPELGGGPTTILTQGLAWASLSIRTSPKPSINFVIHSPNDQSAKALNDVIVKAVDLAMASLPRNLQPTLPKLIPALMPKQQANRLVSAIDQQSIPKLMEAIVVMLQEARQTARRVQSASHMKQILLQCIMHVDEHKGEWPKDLQVLVQAAGFPSQLLTNPRRPANKPGYVYLKPSDPANMTPDLIILYEATEGLRDNINVGFADGHVELMTMEAFQAAIKQQTGQTVK